MEQKAKINCEIGVGAAYGFKVFGSGGECRLELPVQRNIMLDRAEVEMARTSRDLANLFGSCVLGVGTAEPQPSDSGLTSPVGSSRNFSSTTTTSEEIFPGVWKLSHVATASFNTAGDAGIDGVQLSEVGAGISSSNIVSKSLIKDMEGNPTSIQLLPYEVLQVTREASIYLDTRNNVTGTFTLNEGQPDEEIFDYEMNYLRASSSNVVNGWMSSTFGGLNRVYARDATDLTSVTSTNLGSAISTASNADVDSHVPGTNYRTTSAFFDIGTGNATNGITGFTFNQGSNAMVQCVIRSQNGGGGIMKTTEHTLSLDNFFRITYTTEIPEE